MAVESARLDLESLASFIQSHEPAQALITCEGTLLARTWETRLDGPAGWSQWETIEPTMQAARDWLGY